MYSLEVSEHLDSILKRLRRKDREQINALAKKVEEIQKDPRQREKIRAIGKRLAEKTQKNPM